MVASQRQERVAAAPDRAVDLVHPVHRGPRLLHDGGLHGVVAYRVINKEANVLRRRDVF